MYAAGLMSLGMFAKRLIKSDVNCALEFRLGEEKKKKKNCMQPFSPRNAFKLERNKKEAERTVEMITDVAVNA